MNIIINSSEVPWERPAPVRSVALVTIADLKVGDEARVVDIDPANELRRRLMELGITPGIELRVIRIAPLGDPLEVYVRGYRLSLRRADAASIRCAKG